MFHEYTDRDKSVLNYLIKIHGLLVYVNSLTAAVLPDFVYFGKDLKEYHSSSKMVSRQTTAGVIYISLIEIYLFISV